MKEAPPRLGQIAITVNGECCPPTESKSAQVSFAQRVFELQGGPMTGVPGVVQLASRDEIYERAIEWLQQLRDTTS